jgi:hypothetical protein
MTFGAVHPVAYFFPGEEHKEDDLRNPVKAFFILHICFLCLLVYIGQSEFATQSPFVGSVVFALVNLVCGPIVMALLFTFYVKISTHLNVSAIRGYS